MLKYTCDTCGKEICRRDLKHIKFYDSVSSRDYDIFPICNDAIGRYMMITFKKENNYHA